MAQCRARRSRGRLGVIPRGLAAQHQGRLTLLWCVAGTLVAFTLVLVRIWGNPLAPNCGCLSLLKIASRTNHEAGAGVVRNIALLVIVGWLLWNALRRSDMNPHVA